MEARGVQGRGGCFRGRGELTEGGLALQVEVKRMPRSALLSLPQLRYCGDTGVLYPVLLPYLGAE